MRHQTCNNTEHHLEKWGTPDLNNGKTHPDLQKTTDSKMSTNL